MNYIDAEETATQLSAMGYDCYVTFDQDNRIWVVVVRGILL